MSAAENVHATGLVLDGVGVMIRGPSGSGKSLLALRLLDAWQDRGLDAALVADDRLDVSVEASTLIMAAPAAIAGKIELRGRGIIDRPYVPTAPVALVIDLVDALQRMPDDKAFSAQILGIALTRCPVPRLGVVDAAHQMSLVREAISLLASRGTKTS